MSLSDVKRPPSELDNVVPRDETRPFKKARLFGALEEIITISVGTSEMIPVHKNILCSSSHIFQAACNTNAEKIIIKLPEAEPDTVKDMVYWMYYNVICVPSEVDGVDAGSTNKSAMKTVWGFFAKLYVLASTYQMPRLRNCAIDAMLCRWKDDRTFAIGINHYVYSSTDADAPLRKLLVRMTRLGYRASDILGAKNMLCFEFAFDVLQEGFQDMEGLDGSFQYIGELVKPEAEFCKSFHMHAARRREVCKKPRDYFTHSVVED